MRRLVARMLRETSDEIEYHSDLNGQRGTGAVVVH